jgi:hypothetical protein
MARYTRLRRPHHLAPHLLLRRPANDASFWSMRSMSYMPCSSGRSVNTAGGVESNESACCGASAGGRAGPTRSGSPSMGRSRRGPSGRSPLSDPRPAPHADRRFTACSSNPRTIGSCAVPAAPHGPTRWLSSAPTERSPDEPEARAVRSGRPGPSSRAALFNRIALKPTTQPDRLMPPIKTIPDRVPWIRASNEPPSLALVSLAAGRGR